MGSKTTAVGITAALDVYVWKGWELEAFHGRVDGYDGGGGGGGGAFCVRSITEQISTFSNVSATV